MTQEPNVTRPRFNRVVIGSNEDEVPSVPGQSSDESALGLGSWRTPSADRPTLVQASIVAETDGGTQGEVRVEVDEDGGTTSDYDLIVSWVSGDNSAGTLQRSSQTILLPPGASYRFNNVNDPTGNNSISTLREFSL